MSELRWHPILQNWVITATHRQDRTFHPPDDYCPLCPTKPGIFPTEVFEPDYDIVVFENKFASLAHPAHDMAVSETGLYHIRPADGVCEVVCYTSAHHSTLADLPSSAIRNLVEVWTDRYRELANRDYINYVLIFENKGKDIGVTISHPHGQIYAFPFIPPQPACELESSAVHHNLTGRCLFCDVLNEEIADGRRIVVENDRFIAFVPFFAQFPYEVYVLPKGHHPSMLTFCEEDRTCLANILKVLLLKYNTLWSKSIPYMMILHQAATDGGDYNHYHFHIEFHPPNRTKTKLKYLAGCETGARTYINDTLPEETAKHLRKTAPETVTNTFLLLEGC